jgi:hypothetical protein
MAVPSDTRDSQDKPERIRRGSSRVGLVIKVVALTILVIGVTSCIYAMSRYG